MKNTFETDVVCQIDPSKLHSLPVSVSLKIDPAGTFVVGFVSVDRPLMMKVPSPVGTKINATYAPAAEI